MKYIIKNYHRKISDSELIKDLRRTARKIGANSVTSYEYDDSGEYDSSTLMERFGSWNNSLARAGLKIRVNRNISTDDLLLNLKLIWDKIRRQPKYYDIQKPLSLYSYPVYLKRFGGLHAAFTAFEKWINKRKEKVNGQARIVSYKHKRKKRVKRLYLSIRYEVLKRDNFKCVLCGANPAYDPKVNLHVDHIKPVLEEGKNSLSNLRTLCSDCNLGKGAKTK